MVEGEIDAVISDAVLREIVRADLFLAAARSNEAAAVRGITGRFFLLLAFQQTGTEHGHGLLAVLELTPSVLTADNHPGGKVHDLHGGIGRVDALPSVSAGAAHLDAEVIGPDLDIDFLGLGQNGHRGGRGVNASLRLGGRHALHPVDTAFVFQPAEHFLARYLEDHFAEASGIGWIGFHRLDLPSAAFGVAHVHPHEIAGKNGGFIASGPRPDFDKGIAVLGRIPRQQGVLNFRGKGCRPFLQPRQFIGSHGRQLGILSLRQLGGLADVPPSLQIAIPRSQQPPHRRMLARHFPGLPRIRKEIRRRNGRLQFMEAQLLPLDQFSVIHGAGFSAAGSAQAPGSNKSGACPLTGHAPL